MSEATFDNGVVRLYQGDARQVLGELPAESVHCVVTSPPYWGLRDYGLEPLVWGGDDHEHEWGEESYQRRSNDGGKTEKQLSNAGANDRDEPVQHAFCPCGAWRGSLGLEPTIDLYVQHIVEVFREVWRVLRKDGTLWLNMGDSYAGSWGAQSRPDGNDVGSTLLEGGSMLSARQISEHPRTTGTGSMKHTPGLKPKDLCMMPARVALALQQPYHTGLIRRDVDAAWLAGLVDADGSIGIRKQAPREGRGTNPTFIPYLSVSCSDVVALERCRAITGVGNINLKHEAGSTDYRGIETKRDYFTWRLDGQVASKVIRDIYPYLVIKPIQAQLVYNMNLSLKWGRPTRAKPVPPDVVKKRERLYETVKMVNQRRDAELPALDPVEPAVEPGWWLRSDIVWSKPNPMPESVTDRPTRAHEYLFLLTKAERYYYDADAIREPVSEGTAERYLYAFKEYPASHFRHGAGYGIAEAGDISPERGRNKRSVWEIPTEPYPEAHFATFPQKLVEPCILAGCPTGGTVLDPFAGSGTVAYVAQRLGRRAIAIDLSAVYLALAEKRMRGQTLPMGLAP